jgi:hypothetical protein
MFYEDHFDPTVDNDIASVDLRNQKKRSTESARNADKNYEKYTITLNKVWSDGRYYKTVTVEDHGSGQIGSKIRNAVTAQRYNHLVGSINEDLFFKVSEASGLNGRNEPLRLYYDTPEQYENHHFVSVNQTVKENWYAKSLAARKRLKL